MAEQEAAASGAEPMEVEAEATSAVQPQLTVDVLRTIKSAQAQNGLKHGDFMRYRRFCTTRVQSLYKVLKMQHGKTKYQKRKLEPHNCSDPRHLLVPLMNAERAWAYAMEFKKEIEQRMEPRKRNHLLRRLAKAQLWASEFARLAAARCDTRSALEAEAYACLMAGNLGLEKEADWQQTLARFTRAKRLFDELAKVGDLEQQALCLQQVEEMEPALRYCNYQISRAGGQVPDASELLALADQEGRAGMELLQSKLATLYQEAQVAQAASTSVLEWPAGTKHAVRNEKVKVALHTANDLHEQITQLRASAMDTSGPGGDEDGTGPGSSPLDACLSLYDKMINALGDARAQVRNAQKSLSGPEAEAQYAELAALEDALAGLALQRTVERSQLMVAGARTRFNAGLARMAAGKKAKDNRAYARPEDVVRLLEGLLRAHEDLADLGARLGGRQGEALHEDCSAQAAAARALRAYHVAHAYLAAGDKAREAAAMFGRTLERVAQARERLAELPAGAQQAHTALLADLAGVEAQATAYMSVARAESQAAEAKAAEEVAGGVGSLDLTEAQQQAAAAGPRYLADNLEAWESFAPGQGRPARLFKPPFSFHAIPVRPIMLDTASSALQYPSLEGRVRRAGGDKKAAGSSMLSSLFSWRR